MKLLSPLVCLALHFVSSIVIGYQSKLHVLYIGFYWSPAKFLLSSEICLATLYD